MCELKLINHPFKPVFNKCSKILMLGSFPSPKSRQEGFYFAHPKNRFWPILSALFNEKTPTTNEDKINFLLSHKIALWDVVKSCEISGASDSSIKNVVANNFNKIFSVCKINAVFTLGNTATKLYKKHVNDNCINLPSTSPANCKLSFDAMLENYKIILNYL